jgi:hypothetical protein
MEIARWIINELPAPPTPTPPPTSPPPTPQPALHPQPQPLPPLPQLPPPVTPVPTSALHRSPRLAFGLFPLLARTAGALHLSGLAHQSFLSVRIGSSISAKSFFLKSFLSISSLIRPPNSSNSSLRLSLSSNRLCFLCRLLSRLSMAPQYFLSSLPGRLLACFFRRRSWLPPPPPLPPCALMAFPLFRVSEGALAKGSLPEYLREPLPNVHRHGDRALDNQRASCPSHPYAPTDIASPDTTTSTLSSTSTASAVVSIATAGASGAHLCPPSQSAPRLRPLSPPSTNSGCSPPLLHRSSARSSCSFLPPLPLPRCFLLFFRPGLAHQSP